MFVDLAPLRDPGLVLDGMARQLGVDERDATPLASLLRTALRERRMLVVLDNFEHVLAARDAVTGLLEACPGVVVLVTSRVALRVRAGREYTVAPLALPGPEDPAAADGHPRCSCSWIGPSAAGDGPRPGRGDDPGRRRDLPPAGRASAGHRAGRGPRPLLPPGHLLARLTRLRPVLVGGPHDLPARQQTHARRHRLELRAAGRAGHAGCFRHLRVFTGAARSTRSKRCARTAPRSWTD